MNNNENTANRHLQEIKKYLKDISLTLNLIALCKLKKIEKNSTEIENVYNSAIDQF